MTKSIPRMELSFVWECFKSNFSFVSIAEAAAGGVSEVSEFGDEGVIW